ncbi:MAG TPA: hypothetical protein VIS07_06170 [Candidatus Binatia bacterium]
MTNDAELRAAVRQAVEAGRLPDRRPDRTWGGRGGGDRCAICTSLVRREEAELELEFVQPDGRLDVYAVHARCFALWEIERQREQLERVAEAAGEPTLADLGLSSRNGRSDERAKYLLSEVAEAATTGGRERRRPDKPRSV